MISSQDGSAVSDRVRGGFLLLSWVSMGVGWWVYGGRCFMHSVPSYSCMFVCVNTALRGVRNTLRLVFSDALMGMCCSLPKHQHPVQTMEGLQSPPPPLLLLLCIPHKLSTLLCFTFNFKASSRMCCHFQSCCIQTLLNESVENCNSAFKRDFEVLPVTARGAAAASCLPAQTRK